MCYSCQSSLAVHRHHAVRLTLSKHVMSATTYNAERRVYNCRTSNSVHRWGNGGLECWAGANPAISVLPHELLLVATAALIWVTHSPMKYSWDHQAVLPISTRSARSHLNAAQNENPPHWIQNTWFNTQCSCCTLLQWLGINPSHQSWCKSTARRGTNSAKSFSLHKLSHTPLHLYYLPPAQCFQIHPPQHTV